MKIIAAFAVGLALASTLSTATAMAQNGRSFVSSHGLDTNACTLAAPCRTLAAAFAATNAGGEIDVLDPADPWKSPPACLPPSAALTSSVSTGLGHAGGTSAGWSRRTSIAFGMKRWTRKMVNNASSEACAAARQNWKERTLSFASDCEKLSE